MRGSIVPNSSRDHTIACKIQRFHCICGESPPHVLPCVTWIFFNKGCAPRIGRGAHCCGEASRCLTRRRPSWSCIRSECVTTGPCCSSLHFLVLAVVRGYTFRTQAGPPFSSNAIA